MSKNSRANGSEINNVSTALSDFFLFGESNFFFFKAYTYVLT